MLRSLLVPILLLVSFTAFSQTAPDTAKNKSDIVDGDKIFLKVDSEAEFPGGIDGWRKYLEENLNPEVPIKKKAPAGTYQVLVRFIVAKDGQLKNISAESSHGYGMEKEVIRIIRKGPNWIPAMLDGKPINAYRRQPVTFMISEE